MLSKKSQYAFKALTYLTQYAYKGPILIAEIARRQNIPLKFLENILLQLKKAGILGSKQGKGGGYFLVADPASVRMTNVMRLMDGPIALLPCASLNFYDKCKDCDEEVCGLNRIMVQVRDATLKELEKRTLADVSGGE